MGSIAADRHGGGALAESVLPDMEIEGREREQDLA